MCFATEDTNAARSCILERWVLTKKRELPALADWLRSFQTDTELGVVVRIPKETELMEMDHFVRTHSG
jgi:hypothetical protein